MLIRSVAALGGLLLAGGAASADTHTFVPISQAIHIAETVARAEGYNLSDDRRYFFDLVQAGDGKPLIAGYVTLGFYWKGDLINTIAVDERSGAAFDTASCTIFDYPALRRYRSGAASPTAPAALKEQTGCDHFDVERGAKPTARPRRR